jgi:ADP-ribosylglycohydrolase
MQHERRAAPRMNRRAILKSGLLATLGAGIGTATTSELLGQSPAAHTDADLREKFFGCIAGCHIGSAMGAPVEGWPWDRIEREYGTLDRLLPYQHYGNGWNREPGTTEDGVERQKLIITAILEKQDRVTAEDVRKAWVQHMNPNAAGLVSEPFEGPLLALAKTPIPAADIGKYCDYSGLVSLSRSCHPIGLINAGDIAAAIQDIHDVGQLYHTANSRGIRWAEVTVVGIAAATKTGATVDSVLGAIFDQCDRADQPYERAAGVRRELERGLKLTEGCADFREMRQRFDSMYSGQGLVYAQSYANEIVTKAVCVLRLTRGNTWETMKAGVNMGRDTDCLTAVAAGLAGALTGAGSIPPALLAQTDRATALNPHTNSQRTLRQTADGLHAAYRARLKRLRRFIEEMDAA